MVKMAEIGALGLVLSAAAGQAQTVPPVLSGTRLELVARGEVRRVPDIAVISAGVVTQAADANSAMRDNAARMARVIAALKKAGLADRDLATSSINLSPQYRYVENQAPVIVGYQASNQLSIRFREIAWSGSILDVLVKEGANQISGPSLQIDKPQAALDEARVAAVKQARSRAELYAGATGLRIKRIVSISEQEGFSAPPMPMAMMARDSAEAKTEVLPGEQALSVSVNVVFELE